MDIAAAPDATRILVVGDSADVVALKHILDQYDVAGVIDVPGALAACATRPPDLMLVALRHCTEVMGALAARALALPPVLVLASDVRGSACRRAIAAGARDVISDPFDPTEVRLRVRNTLEVRMYAEEVQRQIGQLDEAVRLRTGLLASTRLDLLRRLAIVAEFRDDGTRSHALRIGRDVVLLATALGASVATGALAEASATLHDIGKIAIPDAILLKPGRLTAAEYNTMKRHTTAGARMLAGSVSADLRLAETIALTHHERWDGTGYPAGLAGEAIPMAGRIVAVADVFDALAHVRPYKAAWSVPDAVAEIRAGSGTHFDPDVVKAFGTLDHEALVDPVVAQIVEPERGAAAERARAADRIAAEHAQAVRARRLLLGGPIFNDGGRPWT